MYWTIYIRIAKYFYEIVCFYRRECGQRENNNEDIMSMKIQNIDDGSNNSNDASNENASNNNNDINVYSFLARSKLYKFTPSLDPTSWNVKFLSSKLNEISWTINNCKRFYTRGVSLLHVPHRYMLPIVNWAKNQTMRKIKMYTKYFTSFSADSEPHQYSTISRKLTVDTKFKI